jgi:signal transduction histidine kinase
LIAHQINNPLTTILADAGCWSKISTRIHRATLRRQFFVLGSEPKVVEHVLSMARGDDRTRALDINQTIEETTLLLGPQITSQGIRLELELASVLPQVFSSASQLEDVWMNLLINARDAIIQSKIGSGRIRMRSRLRDNGKMIEVSVTDNGGGISPEHIDRVFDPFFTTKPYGKGTGLGLYICQQIISEHGGTVKLHSTLGEGTVVSVRLPVIRDAAEEQDGDDLHRG